MFGFNKPLDIPEPSDCLPGRSESMPVPNAHYVSGHPIQQPFPESYETAVFGLGCFWGAERRFWEVEGVFSTAVGYLGGHTPNPTYEEVCTGRTGHNEVVLVVYDPAVIDYAGLLKVFWEAHNPTQGMRQGNDVGTQYRSGIYTYSDQQEQLAQESKDQYSKTLLSNGYSQVTTEIKPAGEFYYAEPYHQQYLAKNPGGYCGLGGTGVCYMSE